MFARGFLLLAATSAVLGARVLTGAKVSSEAYKHITPVNSRIGAEHHARQVEFTVYLQPSDDEGLTKRMEQIAVDRDLPWLTDQELGQYTKPLSHHLQAIQKHLADLGISEQDQIWAPHNTQVTLKVPAKTIESLFPGTDLHLYKFKDASNPALKAHALHIPDHLSEAITHVSNLVDFPVTKLSGHAAPEHLTLAERERHALEARKSKHARRHGNDKFIQGTPVKAPHAHAGLDATAGETDAAEYTGHLKGCGTKFISAECVRNYYGTYEYTEHLKPDPEDKSFDTTIFGYIGQNPSQADLSSYLKQFRPEAAGYQIPIEDVLGAQTNQSDPTSEPQIDIQLVVGQSWPLKTKYVNLGTPDDPSDIFLQSFDWLLYQGGKDQRPGLVSISYDSEEDGMTQSGAHQMCHAAKKLSALGTTIAVSTGDYGVTGFGSQSQEYCAADGTGKAPYIPLYPITCDFILAVGSNRAFNGKGMTGEAMTNITYLPDGKTSGYYSGAGRSNIFGIPRYQKHDVEVLNRRIADSPTELSYMYNHTGRLYPDLVAQGWWYDVVVGGEVSGWGGTSAATPTTAANLALINHALVKAGKSRLGWANPILYRHKPRDIAFRDVYQGGSFGCTPITAPLDYGLLNVGAKAREGYDAASGLGSFRFKPLKRVLLEGA